MAFRTQEEYEDISISGSLKQRRRITASGNINNFNIPSGPEYPVYYVDYLGKITKMTLDTDTDGDGKTAQAAFDKKFPGGEAALVEPEVAANAETMKVSADKALTNATDACAVMGTLGGLSPDLGALAFNAEKAAGEMLTAVTEVAGVVGEVVSEVATVISEITSIIAEAGTILAQLIAEGLVELAAALEDAISEVNGLVETAFNELNAAIGEAAADVADAIDGAVDTVAEAIAEAGSLVGDLVGAVASGNCKTVSAALAALPVTPPGEAAEVQGQVKNLQPQQSRYLNAAGQVVNFNIDKTKPYADIQYRGKLTRMYFADATAMQARFGTTGTTTELAGDPLDIGAALGGVGGAIA